MQFYARKIQSRPQGAFVDVLHATWDGQWERLERLHGYIQWLFPVFENAGMNWESSPLTKEGARQANPDPNPSPNPGPGPSPDQGGCAADPRSTHHTLLPTTYYEY